MVPPAHPSGTGYLIRWPEGANLEAVEVECVTLDSIQEEVGSCRLLAIDAEGEDMNILRGATGFIQRFQPIILLEASPQLLQRAKSGLTDLHSEVSHHGYHAYRVSRLGLSQRGLTQHQTASNWVCIPASAAHRTASAISRQVRNCGLRPCLAGINPLTSKERGTS